MKRVALLLLVAAIVFLPAATCLDRAAGIEVDPQTGEVTKVEGPAPVETVGGLASTLWAPAGMVLSLLGWGWTEIRKRKLAKAAVATFHGIEDAVQKDGFPAQAKALLYEGITAATIASKERGFFVELLDRTKKTYRRAKGEK